jgi:hypothetical protein
MGQPWYTSRDLVSAVQRKIAMPLNQRTFTSDDVLAFANEEMMLSQVPDILLYHQEYFVWSEDVVLNPNQERYAVPDRAMGQKLRDVFYVDTNGNLFEMTRINPDDKSYWQRESAVINLMQKYYLEGNDIVLAPQNVSSPTGNLRFSYFIRPNQLVDNSRAAIIGSFFTNVTVNHSSMVAGDTLSLGNNPKLIFTAVSGAPSALQFQIGASDMITATNLMNAINLDGTYSATVINPNIVSINYTNLNSLYFLSAVIVNQVIQTTIISSNTNGITVSTQIGINIPGGVPTNIIPGQLTDLLQTRSGHRLYAKDILPTAISTNAIMFNDMDVPLNIVVGDYICQQYECIIPQIPTDLHNGLAERVCARILEAQGDAQGMQAASAKLADIKHSEGILTENRVDGSTQKINQRKSPLSFLRMGIRRRI